MLNGRAVLNQMEASGLAKLEHVGKMPYRPAGNQTDLYEGRHDGVQYLGWSVNLQGTPAANSEWFRERLAPWISARARQAPG